MTFFLFCIFEYIPVPLISLFILIYRWFKANFRSSVIRWISRIWKFWIKYSICFLPILTNAYILDSFMGVSYTLVIKYYKSSIISFDKSKLIKETFIDFVKLKISSWFFPWNANKHSFVENFEKLEWKITSWGLTLIQTNLNNFHTPMNTFKGSLTYYVVGL